MTATPEPNSAMMKAVERLDYCVTVGDVASQAGLEINFAEQGLLALASQAGGHLQVAESGEVVYLFPRNFRDILRNKDFRLRLQDWWEKVWRILFYLIRISFGIVLILLILLVIVAIIALTIAANSSRDDSDRGGSSSGDFSMPTFWFTPDFYWIFLPDYNERRYDEHRASSDLNFLEAVFSFLFGDGNPNANLENKRWKTIASVIRNHRGAVIAEQIAPYLDELGEGFDKEYEQYMLPVLTRFGGSPEVSPEGQLVYRFPTLQTTVTEQRTRSIPAYLQESLYRFSQASGGQLAVAAGLGVLLLVLAIWLTLMINGGAIAISGAMGLIRAIAGISLGYSAAYLLIPGIRYLWIQGRNRRIVDRNQARHARAMQLTQADPIIQQKLAYAEQFAAETVIQASDLIYTTERDLLEQEVERSTQIDAEWQKRLEER
jgi:hypothetical protein